jgi:superfamily II DNA or RNA helicase
MVTKVELLSLIAPGAQVVVRDEEWLVSAVEHTAADGLRVRATGVSELVRGSEAVFLTNLDDVQPLRPEDTRLVLDPTPGFRRSRLFLEAMIRKTPVPGGEPKLALANAHLLNELEYQKRPAVKALEALRPRLLIADAVGLGKTLEVGMILAELIRRGRGERILVVTPRHILEQFQHELWTRFAIPLVRLDSEGIQRVRQKIPTSRNPFAYYKRAIISIDTLKSVGRYRHHLEKQSWDAVVIDECHNLMNRGTLNNQLARVLSPQTDALILTSATPHSGDPESFAELISLLDPTAIADKKNYTGDDIKHLYVRRHKANAEVAAEVGSDWAERKAPMTLTIEASPEEEAVFDELDRAWLHPEGRAPTSSGDSLFPWTLFKAFLSSHEALAQTIENRRKTLARGDAGRDADARAKEENALVRLAHLNDKIDDRSNSKLRALVEQLKSIGVGPTSPTRVVVFSERIKTLDWLASTIPHLLGLDRTKHVRVLHGGMVDVKQHQIIEEFGLADNHVRLLFTGDMASEGVNLHRQCHHLVHFDLPWSLITLEQRNGRIDRYGQRHSPEIRALVLTPRTAHLTGEVRVLAKLLQREHHAHRALGDAASLMEVHAADREEDSIMKLLRDARDLERGFEELVPETPRQSFSLAMLLAGATTTDVVQTLDTPTLFDDDEAFVEEALREAFVDPDHELGLTREPENRLIVLTPPPDLLRRLDVLPQSYLAEQKAGERLKLTFDRQLAAHMLDRAHASKESMWPTVGFVSPLHPVIDWLVDKVLVGLPRNTAPVIEADVSTPVFLVQGVLSNRRGQAQIVEWMAISQPDDRFVVEDLTAVLHRAGVRPGMSNRQSNIDIAALSDQISEVLSEARDHLAGVREARADQVGAQLRSHQRRLHKWRNESDAQLNLMLPGPRSARQREVERIGRQTEDLIESLRTSPDPLVRLVGVLARGA